MTVPVFVDTNVLVYVRDATEPEKQRAAADWMAELWERGAGHLSYQVLKEYYVTLTRKLDPPREPADAREDVLALMAWRPLPTDGGLLEAAWKVQDELGYSWWDALIIAAALRAGARYLLTEDMQSGQEIGTLTIVNPFAVGPEELLG